MLNLLDKIRSEIRDMFWAPEREPARAHKSVPAARASEVELKLQATWQEKEKREKEEREQRLEARKPLESEVIAFTALVDKALTAMIDSGAVEKQVVYRMQHSDGYDTDWCARIQQEDPSKIRIVVFDQTYNRLYPNAEYDSHRAKPNHAPPVNTALVKHFVEHRNWWCPWAGETGFIIQPR